MESVGRVPAVANLPLTGTICFNSTHQPTESFIDSNSLVGGPIAMESTKAKGAKKSRNAGERIQRR